MPTIRQLLDTLDRSARTYCWVCLEQLASEFGLNLCVDVDQDSMPVKAWYHQDATWVCTDTQVGVKFVFLNDEFVAATFQDARKSDELIEWASAEARLKLFDYLVTLVRKVSPENLVNMDEDASSWITRKKYMDEFHSSKFRSYSSTVRAGTHNPSTLVRLQVGAPPA